MHGHTEMRAWLFSGSRTLACALLPFWACALGATPAKVGLNNRSGRDLRIFRSPALGNGTLRDTTLPVELTRPLAGLGDTIREQAGAHWEQALPLWGRVTLTVPDEGGDGAAGFQVAYADRATEAIAVLTLRLRPATEGKAAVADLGLEDLSIPGEPGLELHPSRWNPQNLDLVERKRADGSSAPAPVRAAGRPGTPEVLGEPPVIGAAALLSVDVSQHAAPAPWAPDGMTPLPLDGTDLRTPALGAQAAETVLELQRERYWAEKQKRAHDLPAWRVPGLSLRINQPHEHALPQFRMEGKLPDDRFAAGEDLYSGD